MKCSDGKAVDRLTVGCDDLSSRTWILDVMATRLKHDAEYGLPENASRMRRQSMD